MATAEQIASAGVYVTDDIGLEVTDGANSRVQLGLLPTGGAGSYGLRVVSSDGTTVIIDGTSDMFKIVASGTLSNTCTVYGGVVTATATITGYGSGAPAFHGQFQLAGTSFADDTPWGNFTAAGAATEWHLLYTANNAPSDPTVNFQSIIYSTMTLPASRTCKYYIFKEAAF